MTSFGTHSVLDTYAAINATVADYGEDRLWEGLERVFNAHNALMDELARDLIERTTDRLRAFGSGGTDIEMQELDEYGQADAQKTTPTPVNVGFPLRSFGGSLQWTRKYIANQPVSGIAATVRGFMAADRRNVNAQIKRALFRSTNYTFRDKLVDNVQLPVKALLNADSAEIPLGPNGETFNGATHTHYFGSATFTAAGVNSVIATVLEHHNTGSIRVYINLGDETDMRALPDFKPYTDARLIPAPAGTEEVARGTLDLVNVGNRAIGLYREAEVWVKPWMPASYVFAFNPAAPKPLAWRTRPGAGNGDFALVYEDERFPLRARSYEREFGIGVAERSNGAIVYMANATYAVPTITA